MITVKEFPNKQFATKEDLFKALRENKETLIAQKKMETKQADAVVFQTVPETEKGEVIKAGSLNSDEVKSITAKLVINTTNILDSHSDVHLKGIWNKSVKEQKNLYLLQEHRMKFDHIITDNVKASVELMTWKDLGTNYKGNTEALVFYAVIDKRNDYMFKQYAKGYVKNHSVGMRYVKMELAINSENKYDAEEKEVWDKYINEIINKEVAEAQGYFFAVIEAKIIEGSAVPIGSNTITPTLEVKNEPSKDTQTIEADKLKSLQTSKENYYKSLLN